MVLESFYNRRNQFRNEVRETMLEALNAGISNLTKSRWIYEDGYFLLELTEKDTVLILRSEFAPYVYDVVSILRGKTLEELSAMGADEISSVIEDMFYEDSEGETKDEM